MSDKAALVYAVVADSHSSALLCQYLQPDYRVCMWHDRQAVVEAIKDTTPALLLIDLDVAPAESHCLVTWLASQYRYVPVVLISGDGVSTNLTGALQRGGWDYLLKPLDNPDLVRLVVQRVLERARLQRHADGYKWDLEQAVARRVDELHAANQQLRLSAIAFETHDAITITDRNGIILRVNEATERMTGYSQGELVGKSPRIWQSGLHSDLFFQRMRVRLELDGCWQGVLWNRSRNNHLFPVWQSISAVCDESGRICHYVGIATDLSELKAKERVLAYRAREERVLGGLASLALEQSDRGRFLSAALALLRTHLDELCLLDRIQVWRWDGEDFRCEERGSESVAAAELPRCLLHAAQREGQFYQDGCAIPMPEEGGQITCLLIPLRSSRQEIGVLVLYSEADSVQPMQSEFFQRLGEVLSLSMLHQQTERELHHQASHDHLTGLPNRLLLTQLLQQQLKTAQRRSFRGAVLFIDLDNFKTLNDSLGHSQGDELLRQLGARVRRSLRDEDILARLGGDEFVVVLPPFGCTSEGAAEMASQVAAKILDAIHQPFQLGAHEYLLGASIGVVTYPEGGCSVDDLLKRADSAMYQAKAAGRNSVRFFVPELQQAADQRLDLEHKLRRAVERDELLLFYQPQFDARLEVVGAEVLLRWCHDEQWISPAEFIPIAEDSGLILSIGNWVLDQACLQLAHWNRTGVMSGSTLSVNISPNQFYQPGFVEQVFSTLRRHQVNPSCLVLEITEGVVLRNVDEAISLINALKRIGIRFALDDFGTGYSSLSYLKRLPVDELKIDQSFVVDVDRDPDDAMIVDAILSLAGHFGLKVVAEGVETPAALHHLQQRGCPLFQGYHLSRPMAAHQLQQFLADRESNSA